MVGGQFPVLYDRLMINVLAVVLSTMMQCWDCQHITAGDSLNMRERLVWIPRRLTHFQLITEYIVQEATNLAKYQDCRL